ncbi:MAG TPA: SgcJ/EcaC family oxidoreductase [Rhodanobacteraceae bacterium]|nr:SgcJ/EcaC family oxidoreductase [Rhodanobacteraceae bacterium]
MRNALCRPVFLLLVALCPTGAIAHDSDQSAVRRVALQQADAWNRHDAAAYSALFTPDCDVVNVVGWWWKSRAEMQQKLTRAFASVFADSTLVFTDVQVKFLTPDIAIAHARWKMSGARMPPGMPPPQSGIQTLVLTRHAGKWLISEFQNTLGKPEHPFPARMPPAAGSGGTRR